MTLAEILKDSNYKLTQFNLVEKIHLKMQSQHRLESAKLAVEKETKKEWKYKK